MNDVYRQIMAALTGAICLAGFSMLTDFVFWFSLCISAGVGLGMYFTIPAKQPPHEIEIAPGVFQADLDSAIFRISEYQEKFLSLTSKCPTRRLAARIRDISDTLERISFNFQEDPRDLKNADLFLNQYLSSAYDLVSKSLRLADLYSNGGDKRQTLSVDATIEQVHTGFKDFYQQCLQNDLIDMEVNAEMLKSITEMDLD